MAVTKKVKDEMLQRFQDQYGIMKPALHYNSPFELMIAVILSAQCTDERVNIVTAGLFPEYNTAEKMLSLGLDGLEEKIRTCGLYHSKAKNILANCAILCEDYGGEVPQTFEELVKLPGVGRKTANVVMNVAFGEPAIAVDTHIFRVCNRTGFAPGKNPTEVEEKLLKVVPKDYLLNAHHWLLLFGRYICKARNPECVRCPVAEYCSAPEKTEALAKAAEEAADLKPGSPAKKPRAKKKPTLPEVKSNDRSV